MSNRLYWANHIKMVFLPQINLLHEGTFDRVFPAFGDDQITRDAETTGQEIWNRLSSQAGPDADPGDIAYSVEKARFTRFEMLMDLRQSLMNLFSVALHHLIEQQQLLLLRREFLPANDENKEKLLKIGEFKNRCTSVFEFDVSSLPGWDVLKELKIVANVVKHAEGKSAENLRKKHPNLFNSPSFHNSQTQLNTNLGVYLPLAGEDIYVSEKDLRNYFNGALRFWGSFTERLEKIS